MGAHGKRFPTDPLKIIDELFQAPGDAEAMLDRSNGDAFGSAFVALPEVRRSLTVR